MYADMNICALDTLITPWASGGFFVTIKQTPKFIFRFFKI